MVFSPLEIRVRTSFGNDKILVFDIATEFNINTEATIPIGLTAADLISIRISSDTGKMEAVFDDNGNEIIVELAKVNPLNGDSLTDLISYYFTKDTLEIPQSINLETKASINSEVNSSGPIANEPATSTTTSWLTSNMATPSASKVCKVVYEYEGQVALNQQVIDVTAQETLLAAVVIPVNDTGLISEVDVSNDLTGLSARNTDTMVEIPYMNFQILPSNAKGTEIINTTNSTIESILETPLTETSVEVPSGVVSSVELPPPGEEPTVTAVVPSNLTCLSSTDDSITLQWMTTNGLFYEIRRDGMLIETTMPAIDNLSTTYQDMTVTPFPPITSYVYTLTALDANTFGEVPEANSTATCTTICILPGATVLTPSGKKLIDDIVAGDTVVDENGNHVQVIHNIRSGPSKRKVVRFNKGCFGSQKPDAPITITTGHPIKRRPNTKEAVVESYIDHGLIQSRFMKLSHTFTLMTKQRCFIMTNNIPVATYSEADFEKECQKMRAAGTPLLYQLL